MKKVVVITSSYPKFDGDDAQGKYIVDICKEIAKNFEVRVIAPRPKDESYFLTIEGIRCDRFTQNPFGIEICYGPGIMTNISKSYLNLMMVPFLLLQTFFAIVRVSNRKSPDILNPHWIVPQATIAVFYKLLVKKLLGRSIKVIGTAHGTDINGLNGKYASVIKKWTLKHLDGVIAVSSSLEEKILELGYAGPIKVVSMGVDTSLFSPASSSAKQFEGSPKIVFAGSITKTKGVLELLKVMPSIVEQFPGVKLYLIGNGDLKEECVRYISQNDLYKSIEIVDPVPQKQLARYFQDADLVVLPSYREGFSMVVAEALSCGTKTLMTANTGVADIIVNRAHRSDLLFTFTHDDHNESLKTELVRALSEPDSIHKKQERRQFVLDHFSLEKCGKEFNSFFELV